VANVDTELLRRAALRVLPTADSTVGPADRVIVTRNYPVVYVYDNRLLEDSKGDTTPGTKAARAGSLTRCGWSQASIGTNVLIGAGSLTTPTEQ
jgi:hypothetical protein